MASLDLAGPVPGVSQMETADDWEAFFRPMQADGVLSGMVPTLNSGTRSAVISAGSAFLRAYIAKAASSNSTAIAAASGQDRIDRLVLRLDRTASTEANWIKPVVITGTPGASPVAPAIQATDNASWDLPISHWRSTSAGALTGLVDDRVFAAGPAQLLATSGQTPLQARPGLLIDPANPDLLYSADGSAWETVVTDTDTGWQAQSVNGSNSGSWSASGTCHVRLRNRTATLRFIIQRTSTNGDLLASFDAGSNPFTLDTQYRPSNASVIFTGFAGISNAPRTMIAGTIGTDGTVTVNAIDKDVPVGRTVGAQISWPLG